MPAVVHVVGFFVLGLIQILWAKWLSLFPGWVKIIAEKQLKKKMGILFVLTEKNAKARQDEDVQENGEKSLLKVRIYDPRVYQSAVRNFNKDFFDDYVNGYWDCDDLEKFIQIGNTIIDCYNPVQISFRGIILGQLFGVDFNQTPR